MSKFLLDTTFHEHAVVDISSIEISSLLSVFFKQKADCKCIEIKQNGICKELHANYYIGTDWIYSDEIAIYVAPKLNENNYEIDYLKMLFSCLKHPDVASYTRDLYEIKFESPFIEITQKQDLLTPLLIIHFLQVLKSIVRKGLRKSYYRVESNLNAKVKGKVLIAQNIKHNLTKNEQTKIVCQYDEFGFNCIENRILKKTLVFIQRYLALFPDYSKMLTPIINYCLPAFVDIDDNISLDKLKQITHNAFYKEYKEAIQVANLILRRFGYNMKEIETSNNKIKVPPFWIDMSKLFELYTLGLLKDKYSNKVQFQIQGTYGQPDFILIDEDTKMIIDTKYKRKYQQEKYWAEDIRQLSGYARDTNVLRQMGIVDEEQGKVVDCLIIYPDQSKSEQLDDNLKENAINGFQQFYKMAIKLPETS